MALSLDRLVGTWDITMNHSAVAEPVTGRQRYERVLDGSFVMLHWTYDHPEFPDAIAVLDAHTYHYFDVRGVTRVFEFTLDESGWSMIRRDEDFWQRSTGTFLDDDHIESNGENSFDAGASWQHDFRMSYVRRA